MSKKKKLRVIISVWGGVAGASHIPDGVEVEIRDFDNGKEVATPDGYSDGEPYCSYVEEGPL